MIKPPADEGFAEKCAILFPSSNMGSMSEASSWAGGVAAVELAGTGSAELPGPGH